MSAVLLLPRADYKRLAGDGTSRNEAAKKGADDAIRVSGADDRRIVAGQSGIVRADASAQRSLNVGDVDAYTELGWELWRIETVYTGDPTGINGILFIYRRPKK